MKEKKLHLERVEKEGEGDGLKTLSVGGTNIWIIEF